MSDTIFALATPPGRSAIAILRLSGPGTGGVLKGLRIRPGAPRRANLRILRDSLGGAIDEAVVIRFPAPHSYTGEDMAELHLHGGEGVVERAVEAIAALGPRPAQPGEFTRRAFENGRLSLDRAEAVADLVDAQTAAQAQQAVRQLRGALGARYESWRKRLLEALSRFESAIDFVEEEIPDDAVAAARAPLAGVLAEIDAALADAARGRRIRDGYAVAILGAPNAGKSSLFNALLERDAAIVTPIPGATRDVIEAPLRLGPWPVLLADMAGLRASDEPIEAEGVRRAAAWASEADLRLWVVDGSVSDGSWRRAADAVRRGDLCVINKTDLGEGTDSAAAGAHAQKRDLQCLPLSLTKGDLREFSAALAKRVGDDLAGASAPLVTRERHQRLLGAARERLAQALERLEAPELAAENTRLACRALAEVTGRIGVEDVLDEVFATFCIGK